MLRSLNQDDIQQIFTFLNQEEAFALRATCKAFNLAATSNMMMAPFLYRVVEPRDEVKGLIARAHLYMASTYPFKLSPNQEEMFNRWNKTYPPTLWEIQWNNKIREIQGNDNFYIIKHPETYP